ncbi:MAG: hypothetical protein ACO33Y_07155, partial [Burkholderiaceae bacterium]
VNSICFGPKQFQSSLPAGGTEQTRRHRPWYGAFELMDRGRKAFLGPPSTAFLYQSLANGF